ncbi:MAG: hypothetical protein ACOC9P_01445 [bacterium]
MPLGRASGTWGDGGLSFVAEAGHLLRHFMAVPPAVGASLIAKDKGPFMTERVTILISVLAFLAIVLLGSTAIFVLGSAGQRPSGEVVTTEAGTTTASEPAPKPQAANTNDPAPQARSTTSTSAAAKPTTVDQENSTVDQGRSVSDQLREVFEQPDFRTWRLASLADDMRQAGFADTARWMEQHPDRVMSMDVAATLDALSEAQLREFYRYAQGRAETLSPTTAQALDRAAKVTAEQAHRAARGLPSNPTGAMLIREMAEAPYFRRHFIPSVADAVRQSGSERLAQWVEQNPDQVVALAADAMVTQMNDAQMREVYEVYTVYGEAERLSLTTERAYLRALQETLARTAKAYLDQRSSSK